MNKITKTLTTIGAAAALVTGVGLSIAQTSGNQLPDPNAAPVAGDKAGTTGNVWRNGQTQAAPMTPSAAPQQPMSSTDTTTMAPTTSESSSPAPLAPQADRN